MNKKLLLLFSLSFTYSIISSQDNSNKRQLENDNDEQIVKHVKVKHNLPLSQVVQTSSEVISNIALIAALEQSNTQTTKRPQRRVCDLPEDLIPVILSYMVDNDMIQNLRKSVDKSIIENDWLQLKNSSAILNFYATHIPEYKHYENYIAIAHYPNGNSFLHKAVTMNKKFIHGAFQQMYDARLTMLINQLLKHGVDPHEKNKAGETAMHLAAKSCNIAMIKKLKIIGLDVNAATNKTKEEHPYNAKTDEGATSLHYAVITHPDNIELIEWLVFLGADMNARNSQNKTMLKLLENNNKLPSDQKTKLTKIYKDLGAHE